MDFVQSDALNSEIQNRISESLERLSEIERRDHRQFNRELQELIQPERENRLMFERNPLPMWIFDADTLAFLDVNEAAVAEYGYSREEFLSMTLHDLRPSAEDDAALMGDIERRSAVYHRDGPWRHRRKDGSIIEVEITSVPIEYHKRRAKFIMAADVTERRRAERELGTHIQSLARSNNDLKQFAYAASHDLQEPIRNVILFTQLLARSWGKAGKDKTDEYIESVVEGAKRIRDLVEGLRLYWELAESEPKQVRAIDAGMVVRRVLERLSAEMTSAGGVFRYGPLPTLPADERELFMVFEALLSNALKFRAARPLEVAIFAEQKENKWRISVQDNGMGMDPSYTSRIFDIFKRLSRSLPGTGMGLPIAQKIIQRYGGRIWAESEEGRGSTFHFTWPTSVHESSFRAIEEREQNQIRQSEGGR